MVEVWPGKNIYKWTRQGRCLRKPSTNGRDSIAAFDCPKLRGCLTIGYHSISRVQHLKSFLNKAVVLDQPKILYLTCPTTISSANPKVNRRVFAREWPTCDTFCSWGTCIKPGLGKHNSPWFEGVCLPADSENRPAKINWANVGHPTVWSGPSNTTLQMERWHVPPSVSSSQLEHKKKHTLPGVNFRSSQGLRYVDNCRHIPRFQPNSAAQLSHHADPCRCFAEVPPRRCSFWDKESADSSGSPLNLGGVMSPAGLVLLLQGPYFWSKMIQNWWFSIVVIPNLFHVLLLFHSYPIINW